MPDFRIDQYLDVARTQLGCEEHPRGSNWGHPVQDYLKSVGINFPAPWCAAFVCWCLRQGGLDTSYLPSSGSTTFLLNLARHNGTLHQTPEVGDIFLLVNASHQKAHHTGFVTQVNAHTVNTIEGNTDTNGSPEGYEVAARTRALTNDIVFLRII